MRVAMITIEVLISMLILFMVIATSVTAIKELGLINKQQIKYEELYISVLNIKAKIDNDVCKNTLTKEGDFSGFRFKAECHKTNELKKYLKAFDEGDEEGNIGRILLTLYSITLTLQKDHYKKIFTYEKMVAKNL